MILLPYHVDVPMRQMPIVNWILIGLIVLISIGALVEGITESHPLLLKDWSLTGLLGSTLIHAGPVHLFGNMLFLWLFGNAICAKVGNALYPGLFVLFALVAGAAHLIFTPGPALGASGAINGMVGMFLVLYPLNDVRCFVGGWLIVPIVRSFSFSSYWLILFWLFWDVLGFATGGGGVAYAAHLGGFVAGFGVGMAGWYFNLIPIHKSERSLPAVITGNVPEQQSPLGASARRGRTREDLLRDLSNR